MIIIVFTNSLWKLQSACCINSLTLFAHLKTQFEIPGNNIQLCMWIFTQFNSIHIYHEPTMCCELDKTPKI